MKGFLSLDIDVSALEVNQCDLSSGPKLSNQIEVLRGTHKCHNDTTQVDENLLSCYCIIDWFTLYDHSVLNWYINCLRDKTVNLMMKTAKHANVMAY